MLTRALLAVLLLTSCGKLDYDRLPDDGEFQGSLLVMWVGENTTNAGSGRFVFVPAPGDELRFVRGAAAAGDTVTEIRPGMMYTDGGSIPRQVQFFKGFSPWGYAPAYMVHDWLFVARRCWQEDGASEEEKAIAQLDFIETAEIIGEAIKALIKDGTVQQNDVAPGVISRTVAGPISERLWEKPAPCRDDRVSAAHREQVAAALEPQVAAIILGDPTGRRVTLPRGKPPARLVRTITFN